LPEDDLKERRGDMAMAVVFLMTEEVEELHLGDAKAMGPLSRHVLDVALPCYYITRNGNGDREMKIQTYF
jgi:hypothetical protein